jgi:predicted nucleotide-binding protein
LTHSYILIGEWAIVYQRRQLLYVPVGGVNSRGSGIYTGDIIGVRKVRLQSGLPEVAWKISRESGELEALVAELGWKDDNDKKVFRSEDKVVLNWWPSTGTLQFQGPAIPRKPLEEVLMRVISGGPPGPAVVMPAASAAVVEKPSPPIPSINAVDGVSERVFVVYGHDEAAREQLELVLHRLDLDPFVLGNTSGSGLTIIEALEKEILSPNRGKRFGIVLLTPDDMGYKQEDGPEKAEPRARQNVVMEMGMLIAAFGRPRVAILKEGHVEVPSDASGIIYLGFNNHVKETAAKLCQRLGEAGFELGRDAIARASA